MNKTGTSTLNHCFEELRLTPIASPKSYTREIRQQIDHFYKHRSYDDMLDLAERYKAFEDRPWNMWTMYRHAHRRFPDSRFILTVRDPESWWRSTERWITVTKPHILSRYQQHLRVHEANKDSMIESYLRYNSEVEAYFKGTDQLLVMNLEQGDGWEKLCSFLKLPIPDRDFPHANRQKYTPEDAKMIRDQKRLKRGLECQVCHNRTMVKGSENTTSFSHTPAPLYRRMNPLYIARRIKQVSPERFKDSERARQVFYDLHRVRRALAAKPPTPVRGQAPVFSSVLPDRELAVVACFFNPGNSLNRIANFQAFLSSIRSSGVPCIAVELAFGTNDFKITGHDDVIQLRTNDVLWHKERLLNIGIRKALDEGYRKIAWLDGDIVFADANWPLEIANRLEHVNLCQVFETIAIQTHESGPPMVASSAVKYFHETGSLYMQPARKGLPLLRGVLKGGQSGFGWAARAEVLQQQMLFEGAIVGGGDKMIYIASLEQDFSRPEFQALSESKIACKSCGHRNRSDAYREQLGDWARRWSAAVAGEVDFARLHIADMYHGKRSDRGYMTRHDILYRNAYNPMTDLVTDTSGCLAWAPDKDTLKGEVEAYFLSRREDV
jgi:DNA-directed RNA polymerase subunit RPC12/RpoP